jgi:hypothetical protein
VKRWADVTIGTRSMPGQAGPFARFFLQAMQVELPSFAWASTALGMPLLRISAVRARVSMPEMPMMPRAFSQASRCREAR